MPFKTLFLLYLFILPYLLNTKLCPDDKLCNFCSPYGCTICQESYPRNRICTRPEIPIGNCLTYHNANRCRSCRPGYDLRFNRCYQIDIPGCAMVSPNDKGTCIGCLGGRQVVNGKCDVDLKCSDANCELCIFDYCQECKSGFYNMHGQEGCVEEFITGCFIATPDFTKCQWCNFGFYHNGGVCNRMRTKLGMSEFVYFGFK